MTLEPGDAAVYEVLASADGREELTRVGVSVRLRLLELGAPVDVNIGCGGSGRITTVGDGVDDEDIFDRAVVWIDMPDAQLPIDAECQVVLRAHEESPSGSRIVWVARLFLEYDRGGGHGRTDGDIEVNRI